LSSALTFYSIGAMTPTSSTDPIRKTLATALLVFPCVFGLVFIMHFRRFSDFLKFQTHYVPAPPERVVAALIAHHNDWPLMHDPHMIGYLALPIFPLCAFALYLLGRSARPFVSAVGMMITITGSIYMGGDFGMWTAFFRGLGLVDPSHLAGATATFAAMTAPQGAFLVTTTLAKLTMIGLAVQALTLLGTKVAPLWSTVCIVSGCLLFLLFWDLNNWMLIASVLMLIGFLPLRKSLLQRTDDESTQPAK
jgi:hypothetical protein